MHTCFPSHARSRARRLLGVAILPFLSLSCHWLPFRWEEPPSPVVRRSELPTYPPTARAATLANYQGCDRGADSDCIPTAELAVLYARDQLPLDGIVELYLDGRVIRLEPDRDYRGPLEGVVPYTGKIPFAADALDAEWRSEYGRRYSVFDGRAKTDEQTVVSLDLEALRGGRTINLAPLLASVGSIDWDKSVLVTAPSVVMDPERTSKGCVADWATDSTSQYGKWTFAYLMEKLGNTSAGTQLQGWLDNWNQDSTVAIMTVKARKDVDPDVMTPWKAHPPGGKYDLDKAPFRLLAIANRVDLADNLLYGPGSAGQVRFVFGAVAPNTCERLRLTVGVELDVILADCAAAAAWAQQWIDLASHDLGTTEYNAALEELTELALANALIDPDERVTVRTNEIELLPARTPPEPGGSWELREFGTHLTQRRFKKQQTPDIAINETQELADFANSHEKEILARRHKIPPTTPSGKPFLGASSLMYPSLSEADGTFWMGPTETSITSSEVRRKLSLSTCNGCHARETLTYGHQIDHATTNPKSDGNYQVLLSDFLSGPITVSDPTNQQPATTYDERDRRKQALNTASKVASCVVKLFQQPLRMVH